MILAKLPYDDRLTKESKHNIRSEKPATNQYFLPTMSQLFTKLKIKSGWSGVATIETNNQRFTNLHIQMVFTFKGWWRKVFTFKGSRLRRPWRWRPNPQPGDERNQTGHLWRQSRWKTSWLNKSTQSKPPLADVTWCNCINDSGLKWRKSTIPSSKVDPCLHNEGMLSEDFRNLRQTVELKQLSLQTGKYGSLGELFLKPQKIYKSTEML